MGVGKSKPKSEYEPININNNYTVSTSETKRFLTDIKKHDNLNYFNNESIQQFCISRHLRSCNNITDDISQKIAEPALSVWGIITGLTMSREVKGLFNNKVYVSCLVRTWMTAVIEYMPHLNNSNELTLVVSPYIKEYHMANYIDQGNLPIPLKSQFVKLIEFFDYLVLLQEYTKKFIKPNTQYLNDIEGHIYTISNNLDKILKNGNRIVIQFPSIKENTKDTSYTFTYTNNKLTYHGNDVQKIKFNPYFVKITKKNKFKLSTQSCSNTIRGGANEEDDIENNNDNNDNEENDVINISELDKISDTAINKYNTSSSNTPNKIKSEMYEYLDSIINAYINDTSGTKNYEEFKIMPAYRSNIDLNICKTTLSRFSYLSKQIYPYYGYFGEEGFLLFIDWIRNTVQDTDEYIYVVAHSNLMKDTLKSICKMYSKSDKLQECDQRMRKIKKQNIWDLILYVNSINYRQKNNSASYLTDQKYDRIIKVEVREGEDPPSKVSKKNIKLEKEFNCFLNTKTPLVFNRFSGGKKGTQKLKYSKKCKYSKNKTCKK